MILLKKIWRAFKIVLEVSSNSGKRKNKLYHALGLKDILLKNANFSLNLLVFMVSREYFAEDECVVYFVALHFRECSTNWSPWPILNLKVYLFSFRTWFWCMNKDVYICHLKVFAQWHGHLELCHNLFHVIYLLSCWRGDSPFN